MPTDTQREPTAEEVQLVGHELVEEVELSAPIGASDRIIIAIAKRVREAGERGMLGIDFPASEAPHA